MLFNKVTKEHILKAIKDLDSKSYPSGFRPSTTYDVLYNGKTYPPSAIMAYAYFHAEGKDVEPNFKVGKGSECFDVLERHGFNLVKKENKKMHDKLFTLKQDFLDTWPIEKLEQMVLEDYTNLDREDSFCYWVEQKTKSLGDIRGGSSYKFGIYKMAENSTTDKASNRTNNGEYAWHIKYGNTQEEAFNTIKSILIKIAKASQANNLEAIDIIDLGHAYKWKIAFLYGNFNCLNVFKLDALHVIATKLGIDYTNKTPVSRFHKEIIKTKPDTKAYFSWSHALWQQYETRLRDVKKDFAKWLNANTFESYRAYLGHSNKSIEDRLDEINSYFDDLDFFLVDPTNINGLVSSILFLLSKKEREKNPEFVEYDAKNSNGIPKAILGKNNYLKFLKEKFDYQEPSYWIFQGNPNIYNITNALKAAHLKSWKVVAHKDKIKIGDQVILWQTGDKSGCYALAEVTSEVGVFKEEAFEQQYYLNQDESEDTDRVKIKITKYLADNPVLWEDIKDNPVFSNFKAGNQGTNFSATEEEFNALLNFNHSSKNIHMDIIYSSAKSNRIMPTNKIFYGPPGTGKTFYLKDRLFDTYTLKETSISKEQHFETVVSSCSWWQVIAIVLLDLKKAKVSDIFEHDWVRRKASLSNSKTIRPTIWGQLQSHTINECKYVNVTNRQQPLIFNKTEDSYWEILEDHVEELAPELYDLKDSVTNYNPDPDKIIKHYDFVTFHQSFAYEDFIEGIKPILPQDDAEDTKDLGYTIEDGVFKSLCIKAKNDPEHRYAIFIDEINRGNVSAIFGELITLIEIDKRQGAKNELSIKLPYSKKEFSVPSNLDIYGTMNTADRSVEALDTALRRRFEFKEMMPDYSVIQKETVGGVKLSEVLEKINQRIELLIDRDHTIGHSYFVGVDTEQKLANAFNNKIVPLLQEYFYGDYGKIGLVLGKGFVEKVKNENITFAKFEYENANDFKTPSFVLKGMDETSVMEAVQLLLGDPINKEE
ncbi:EVE domain-containing protein [Oceanihabitans sediminis]|uniref:EVE domain-containing protein n=1 Tax=Oceanihabitans sediminis TaxID=1812012 RepID=UPI00299DC5E4|nr:EVE domain-containing protein [Oceanihabitans sediminis]MDX1279193.1 EVE domain-containing protein [Oceanihabitans sediminis]